VIYPYNKFELNVCNPYKDNERKLKISIFSKFKRDISVKNKRTITKFELDLHIPMTNLHMQFESYICIQTEVRERKLKIFQEGQLCQKIIRPWPNSNLTCIILRCINIPNLNYMCGTVQEIMNGNQLWNDGMTFHGGGIIISIYLNS
jgi:hypothetical protein